MDKNKTSLEAFAIGILYVGWHTQQGNIRRDKARDIYIVSDDYAHRHMALAIEGGNLYLAAPQKGWRWILKIPWQNFTMDGNHNIILRQSKCLLDEAPRHMRSASIDEQHTLAIRLAIPLSSRIASLINDAANNSIGLTTYEMTSSGFSFDFANANLISRSDLCPQPSHPSEHPLPRTTQPNVQTSSPSLKGSSPDSTMG